MPALYGIVFSTDVTGATGIRSLPLQLKKISHRPGNPVHLSSRQRQTGLSMSCIAAKPGRTPNQSMCKATGLGMKWPHQFRANLGREPVLTDRRQAEAQRRGAAGGW